MEAQTFSDRGFSQLQALVRDIAGIHLTPAKKAMVCGRLAKRLKHVQLDNYDDYVHFLTSLEGKGEVQAAIDLITTNETYFFREPKHFDFLRERILPSCVSGRTFRVWSAACSSGEEPYSLAMLLAECLPTTPWEIVASDLSTRVLEKAHRGQYSMERASHIPQQYLVNYCLKGIGSQAGTFVVDPALRARVRFTQLNLNSPLPSLGEFDLIMLRNVLIYFDLTVKTQVVKRMLPVLKPGGHFIVGHSESLNGVTGELESIVPSVYRKPGR